MRIRKVSREVLDRAPRGRELSPRARARVAMDREFQRVIAEVMANPEDVYEVSLGDGEKPATLRNRFTSVRTGYGLSKEVKLVQRGDRFYVTNSSGERRLLSPR